MVNLPHVRFGGARLPSILQGEVAECGLTCLAMIACYHGHRTDLRYLRSRFPSSLKGMTLVQLEMIGSQLDLESRALKLTLEELPHLQTPCVLHWSMNHFVVLAKASDRMLVVHDPARGTCRLSYEEASKQFTGVALELWPKAHFAPADTATRISLAGLIGKVAGWWQAMLTPFGCPQRKGRQRRHIATANDAYLCGASSRHDRDGKAFNPSREGRYCFGYGVRDCCRKRVIARWPRYAHAKPQYDLLLALESGLASIRQHCPRFGQWVSKLESL